MKAPRSTRRPTVLGLSCLVVGVVCFLVAHLVVPDDRQLALCDFGKDCGKAHTYYVLAVMGWVVLLVGALALVIAGTRRIGRRDTRNAETVE